MRWSGWRLLCCQSTAAQPMLHVLPVLPVQVALEDSLVTMSTILSSRFVAGIRPEVEKVERQLNNFSDTLDQWVQVGCSPFDQHHGLHGSRLLSSPDEWMSHLRRTPWHLPVCWLKPSLCPVTLFLLCRSRKAGCTWSPSSVHRTSRSSCRQSTRRLTRSTGSCGRSCAAPRTGPTRCRSQATQVTWLPGLHQCSMQSPGQI